MFGSSVVCQRAFAMVFLVSILLSGCSGDSNAVSVSQTTQGLEQEAPLPLGVGRTFEVDITYDATVPRSRRLIKLKQASVPMAMYTQGVAEAGEDFHLLDQLAHRVCEAEAEDRIPELGVNSGALWILGNARKTYELVCLGNLFLTMAETPTLTVLEIKDDTSVSLNSSGELPPHIVAEVRYVSSDVDIEREDYFQAVVVRPQAASGSATLALLGSTYARAALVTGALQVWMCSTGDPNCPVTLTVPTVEADEGEEWSGTEEESIALFLIRQTAEAWQVVRDSIDDTRKMVLAASRGRMASGDLSPEEERIFRWRGLNDSRLELANLLVGVAPRMFEPDDRLELPDGDGHGVSFDRAAPVPRREYPVMHNIELTEEDRRAEEFLRVTHVDPREANIVDVVFEALKEDQGENFVFKGYPEDYFELAGITPESVVRARHRLIEEAAVLGHPIVYEHEVQPQLSPRHPPRVVGTAPAFEGPEPAFLYGLSAGSVRTDSFRFDLNPDDNRVRSTDYAIHPTEEYATRSIYGSLDFGAAALVQFVKNLERFFSVSRQQAYYIKLAALSVIAEARDEVPLRVDLELSGTRTGDTATLTELDLHLYGNRQHLGSIPQSTFELWWGEEGLECAVSGRVSHVTCDPSNYSVPVVFDNSADTGGGISGRELHYHARSDVPLAAPPAMLRDAEPGTGFVARGIVYLTRKTPNGRVALGGFDVAPGGYREGRSRWERRTQYPVGENILAALNEILAPRPDEPWEPETTCAGLPHNVRLPLEDELTEAVTGSDEIESSFAHYLSLAKTAAREADDLALTLIREGLEIDLRLESAQEELEKTCGMAVNVPSFTQPPGSGLRCVVAGDADGGPEGDADGGLGGDPDAGPEGDPDGGLAVDADENEPVTKCPGNEICFVGRCTNGELDHLLPGEDGDEASRNQYLRRCIGADEEDKVTVTLGSEPTCIFQKAGLPPCACAEGDYSEDSPCPSCPAARSDFPDDMCCAVPEEGEEGEEGEEPKGTCAPSEDGPFGSLSDKGGYEVREAQPLMIVDREISGGGDPPNCRLLTKLRHRLRGDGSEFAGKTPVGSTASALWEDLKGQGWLNYDSFANLAGGVVVNLQPGWHSSLSKGGRPWFSTGSPAHGVSKSFPCEPLLSEVDAEALGCNLTSKDWPLGRSLLCGLEGCAETCGVVVGGDESAPYCSNPSGGQTYGCLFVETNLNGQGDCTGRETIYHRLWRARKELLRLGGYSPVCDDGWGGYAVNLNFYSGRLGQDWITQSVQPIPAQSDGSLERGALVEYQLHGENEQRTVTGLPAVSFGLFREHGQQLYMPYVATSAELYEEYSYWYFSPWVGNTFHYNGCVPMEAGARVVCHETRPGGSVHTSSEEHQSSVVDPIENLGICPYGIVQNVTEQLTFEGNDTEWLPDYDRRSRTVWGRLAHLLFSSSTDRNENNVALLDAMELVCMSASEGGGGCSTDQEELPTVVSAEDFPRLERALNCAAESIEKMAARLVLVDVPKAVADDLAEGSISPTFPAIRGETGETVATLRGSLESVASSVSQLGMALRSFSGALRTARSQLKVAELQKELAGQEALSAISRSISACAAAASPNISVGFGSCGVSTNIGAAIATCADSDTQVAVANMIESIRGSMSDEARKEVMGEVAMAFSQGLDLMAQATRDLSSSYATVNGLLADLDGKRRDARRALSKAMFLGNDSVGREFAVNRVMRARMNTTLERYKDARENAIRMSWLARRAIEQRLGVDLSELTSDMSLVRAPSTWADEVCDLSGHNYDGTDETALAEYDGLYDRIRGGQMESYANIFVGDYVRMLENVVESYRLDYPFQDGRDIAVLSLKNDLVKVYEPCSVMGHNQLFWSSDLTQRAYDGSVGWEVECSESGRCPAVTLTTTSPFSGGLATSELSGIGGPMLGSVPGYRLTLGCLPDSMDAEWTCQVGDADGAGLTQTIFSAEPGLYVLSWYEKASSETPQLRAVVTDANGFPEELSPVTYLSEAESFFLTSGWLRASANYYNSSYQDLRIRFELVDEPSEEESAPSLVWGAPQFEYAGPYDSSTEVYPLAFFPTDDDLTSEVSRCEDLDGSTFRSQGNWTYGCEYYCADGFGGSCSQAPVERSLMRCFYETQFSLSLPEIERGALIPSGSLALGNFNYRIDNIAVNLVGSDLRDCSNSSHPSSCGSSGFIPYSLRHGPPFRIRNYWGDVYSSPLYVGNIEHAKALAEERFLTNPIGTSDRSALADFTREEFRGRPLEGTYRLRIFDVDGLDWSQLEDVQIALRYRYWTHFGN